MLILLNFSSLNFTSIYFASLYHTSTDFFTFFMFDFVFLCESYSRKKIVLLYAYSIFLFFHFSIFPFFYFSIFYHVGEMNERNAVLDGELVDANSAVSVLQETVYRLRGDLNYVFLSHYCHLFFIFQRPLFTVSFYKLYGFIFICI